MSKDPIVKKLSDKWLIACHKYEYSYHFTWLGLPIIQYPQDIIAIQEIIWKVKQVRIHRLQIYTWHIS